ncbi:MAG: L-threonylcarbamoyladenylate synthase [Candidatus Saccharimonadales bacterium]
MVIYSSLADPKLIEALKQGAVGILPTDTIYGLVCRAADQAAVNRLYNLKPREAKTGTLVAASIEQLVELGFKARYLKPVANYWPNPISVVVPTEPSIDYLDKGLGTQPVRIPKHPVLQKLLQQTGPLITTSVNLPGQPEANTTAEAQNYFGNQVDFYVDGGDLSGQPPSTVIRVVDDAVDILRQGAVTINSETGEIE